MKTKYVIRFQRVGVRRRHYFTRREDARAFCRLHGLPFAHIKAAS